MRILLSCCTGMSTALMVQNMQKAAKEQGKDYKIWAVEQSEVSNLIGEFDVLLLGPQVRHIAKKMRKIVGEDFPMDIIDLQAYGRVDGEATLAQAEKLLEGK